jgi:hypothetical protein
MPMEGQRVDTLFGGLRRVEFTIYSLFPTEDIDRMSTVIVGKEDYS